MIETYLIYDDKSLNVDRLTILSPTFDKKRWVSERNSSEVFYE